MTGEINRLETTSAVSPGDPDRHQQNPGQPRRHRPAQRPARSREAELLEFDEHDPIEPPRLGLLINVRV